MSKKIKDGPCKGNSWIPSKFCNFVEEFLMSEWVSEWVNEWSTETIQGSKWSILCKQRSKIIDKDKIVKLLATYHLLLWRMIKKLKRKTNK